MPSFVCGETLCKRSFEADLDADRPWPIKCPACARSLYPEEVLVSTSLEELDPHRGPLMKAYGGKLTPVRRDELAPKGKRPPKSVLDEIVEEADAKSAAASSGLVLRRGSRGYLIALAVLALVVAVVVLWLVTR